MAIEAQNENNVNKEFLKQHLIVDVITVKQQCAPSVSFPYSALVSNIK